MFKHILIATDGSALAAKAVATALTLGRHCGARITALMVVPDYGAPDYVGAVMCEGCTQEELRQRLAVQGLGRLEASLQELRVADYEVARKVVVDDLPYARIIEQARTLGCDLIVMASHGHGALKSALLGSQTLAVLTGSSVPVLVVR